MKRTLTVLMILVAFMGTQPALAALSPHRAANYRNFNGKTFGLWRWDGTYVSLLTLDADYDHDVIGDILDKLDAARQYYAETTGIHNKPRITIAVVPIAGGAALGLPGGTKIEVNPDSWQSLYEGAAREEPVYGQVLFYELGRCYWHFPGLQWDSPNPERVPSYGFRTGFAILMRLKSMDAIGAPMYSWVEGMDSSDVRAEFDKLVDYYMASDVTWEAAIRDNQMAGMENPIHLGGGDLQASMMLALCRDYGDDFLPRFFAAASQLRSVRNAQDAVDNFVYCASVAAGVNLVSRFEEWRWPVTSRVNQALAQSRRR